MQRGKSSGRTDDNISSFKKRLVIFNTETLSVLRCFKERKLLTTVDASGTSDEIFTELKKIFID